MHDNPILISPVANGWVVTLPEQRPADPFTQSIKAGVVFAKGLQKDPMLEPEPEPEETSELKRDGRTFVFVHFKEALDFLRYKIDQE